MSDLAAIPDLLSRAVDAAGPSGERTRSLPGKTGAERLAAVLREIDETMLPRALEFRIGKTARAVVEARARRAVRIEELKPENDETAAARAALDAAETAVPAKCAAMAALLARFAATDGTLEVLSGPSKLPPSVVDKGHSAEDLAKAAPPEAADPKAEPDAGGKAETAKAGDGKAAKPAPEADEDEAPDEAADGAKAAGAPVRALAKALAKLAGTSVLGDGSGSVISSAGSDEPLAAGELAAAVAAQIATNAAFADVALPGPRFVYIGGAGETAPGLVYASDGGEIAAATIAPADLGTALAAWQKRKARK